ncbi:MAG: hypothetical protein DYG96_09250 [Chlorobi bacterium CHB2]|nr:hypothetical protein [Chlorobi bacterium CHB2]
MASQPPRILLPPPPQPYGCANVSSPSILSLFLLFLWLFLWRRRGFGWGGLVWAGRGVQRDG